MVCRVTVRVEVYCVVKSVVLRCRYIRVPGCVCISCVWGLVVCACSQASEKAELLRNLGADVHRVKPVAISNPGHYVNCARQYANR